MTLKRSDIVITRPGTMEEFRRFRATALGWGFLPEPDRRGLPPDEEMMRDVDEAHRCNMKFQGRVELDADWMGMIDYDAHFMESVVRDLNNQPAVTWWVHTYKGHPSYYFCTNAPHYREYLMYQLRRVMRAGTDWLMIDSAIPTIATLNSRYGGCFCEHCMAGFRKYLSENISSEQLEAQGITDLTTFDYGDFLRQQGIDDAKYRAEILAFPAIIPLAQVYYDYQWQEVNALFHEFKRYAQEFSDEYVPMSSNSPFYWAEFMYAINAHDFYTNELEYHPPQQEIYPTPPIYTSKLADAFNRRVGFTAIPSAFEPCRIDDKPGHIRLWIAQAYAFGHVFMVPVKMWTHRFKNEPDRWYHSKQGDYEPIYHFIGDYPELFDNYETVASVALIFSNNAVRQYMSDANREGYFGGQSRNIPGTPCAKASVALAQLNIPHRYILAGDNSIDDHLLDSDLSAYQAIIRFEPSYLTDEQEMKLQQAGERLVTWSTLDDLFEKIESQIEVSGAENIAIVPRYNPDDNLAPTVCHLINANYDVVTDTYSPANINLRLSKSLYGKVFSQATLYAPERDPVVLDCQTSDSGTLINISNLDMWGILKLE